MDVKILFETKNSSENDLWEADIAPLDAGCNFNRKWQRPFTRTNLGNCWLVVEVQMHLRNSFTGLLFGASFLKDSVICTQNWFLGVLQRPTVVPEVQDSGGCDRPLLHKLSFRHVLSSHPHSSQGSLPGELWTMETPHF